MESDQKHAETWGVNSAKKGIIFLTGLQFG